MSARQELIARILRTAEECGWVKRKVAPKLGITRPTLDRWIARYKLQWRAASNESHGGKDALTNYTKKGVHNSPPPNVLPLRRADEAPTFTREMASAAMTQPDDPRVPTNSRMRESLWKRTRKHAIDEGCNAADIIERAVAEYFERLDATVGQDRQ